MLDVMVDLETTGTDPTDNGIFQICAVMFDYANPGVVGEVFLASLSLPPRRFWEESTREWWMHPDRVDLYSKIVSVAQHPKLVMTNFRDWTWKHAQMGQLRLWAKPSHFEYPFLQSYARQFGIELPFHYRNVVDLNSYCRGLAGDPGFGPLDKQVAFTGEVHNAIDDVMHQIKVAWMAKSLVAAP